MLTVASLTSVFAVQAQAADYPSHPIKIIVPFSPGGSTDNYARLLARHLQEAWGQPVIVENRPGATGLIGTTAVKSAEPDGYTLLYTSNSAHVMGPLVRKPVPFDSVADFTPIITAFRFPVYLLASTRLPVNDIREFIALAKSQPGKLAYASVGQGSGGHLFCARFNELVGIDTLHVPYKGSAPAQLSVIAGETDYICDSVGYSQQQVVAGKLKGLALMGEKRSPAAPDAPTMREEGVDITAHIWQGILAPRGLPKKIQNKLADELHRIMNEPEVRERVERDGYELVSFTPDEFREDIQREKEIWQKMIERMNIQQE
jgi:tripartite-type tricarboxylate transporter receptor subunit TctC